MTHHSLIRRMNANDIAAGLALKEMAEWNQLRLDWERFLSSEPNGCFVAETNDTVVGTCTTVSYGELFGWIGMVLVHPDQRRRGLGRALLEAGIEYLEGLGLHAVKLDATPMGKALYDTIGFVDEYGLERWVGTGTKPQAPCAAVRELALADMDAIQAVDVPAFGADRGRLLVKLLSNPAVRLAGSFGARGELEGYLAVRPGQNAIYLGPLVAVDADTALKLWEWGRGVAGSLPVCVDVLLPNQAAVELVRASGFSKQRELIRMYRGNNVSPGQPDLQYAILGPEVG